MARRNTARKLAHESAAAASPREGLTSVPGAPGDATGAATPVTLDRLIHERVRLGIVSALAVHDALSFNDLKATLQITDGNLSVHARKLEDAGYITCTKSSEGRMPRTEYRLTTAGRAALQRYVDHMEALLRALRQG